MRRRKRFHRAPATPPPAGRPTIVLASASPRRLRLLRAAGYRVRAVAAHVSERRRAHEPPAAYARRLARAKAAAVAARVDAEAIVLGADTVVAMGGVIFGKPGSATAARRTLRRLGGRRHRVLTAVCVLCRGRGFARSRLERTWVWMAALSRRDIDRYVASGEPFDKAGGYGIQGRGRRLIERIAGSYTNVVGLPMSAAVKLIQEASRS